MSKWKCDHGFNNGTNCSVSCTSQCVLDAGTEDFGPYSCPYGKNINPVWEKVVDDTNHCKGCVWASSSWSTGCALRRKKAGVVSRICIKGKYKNIKPEDSLDKAMKIELDVDPGRKVSIHVS